ncbi:MAG: hypothetical protein IJ133_01420 [Clostridia bacterium]|nr:hypothetical protein [Clostridia bacterium]
MTRLSRFSDTMPAIAAILVAALLFFGVILTGFALADHFITGALNVAAISDSFATAANIAAIALP